MTEQTSEETTYIGRIKWFNNKKGFGFLSNCETDEDVFIHHSGIKLNEATLNSDVNVFKTVIEGEYVSYQKKIDEESRTVAKNVTGVLGGILLCENTNKKIFVSNRVTNQSTEEGSTGGRGSGRGGGRGGGRGSGRGGGRRGGNNMSAEVSLPNTNVQEDENSFNSLAE